VPVRVDIRHVDVHGDHVRIRELPNFCHRGKSMKESA
jgi:hypothetical protein